MDMDRLALLEEKLNRFIFLEDCDNFINVKTKRLVLDYISDTDVKLQTLMKLYKDETPYDPEKMCSIIQEIFHMLGLTDKLVQKETQYYVIGKTFNGLMYTKFMFDMMTRFLCFLYTNVSTHVFTGSDLSPLVNLKCITTLSIRNNDNITDLTPIESLTTLTRVDLVNCNYIKDFSPISKLVMLEEIALVGSEFLTNLQFLNNLPLTTLYVLNCPNLENISIDVPQLSHASFIGCDGINNLESLRYIQSLKKLELGDCCKRDLNFIKELLSVEELYLETDAEDIKYPPNIKYINNIAVS